MKTGNWWRPVALALAALGVLWYFPPPPLAPYRLCGFHWLTGRPCALCGVTRAVFALAKGRWGEAIHLNALSPLALAMLLVLPWPGRFRARLWSAGLALFALYGLGRVFLPFV